MFRFSLNYFFELSFVIFKKKIEIKGDFIFLMNVDGIFFFCFQCMIMVLLFFSVNYFSFLVISDV